MISELSWSNTGLNPGAFDSNVCGPLSYLLFQNVLFTWYDKVTNMSTTGMSKTGSYSINHLYVSGVCTCEL